MLPALWQLLKRESKAMTIDWAALIAAVLSAIHCPAPTPATLREAVNNPGPLQELRNQRMVRQSQNLSGKDWRQNKAALMAEFYAQAKAATDDDLQELIDQAAA